MATHKNSFSFTPAAAPLASTLFPSALSVGDSHFQKSLLLLHSPSSSSIVNYFLKDIFTIRSPHVKSLNRGNVIYPFEDSTSLQFFCTQNQCSLVIFGSHSKKRPNNIILGRTFDGQMLDLFEFGIEGKSVFGENDNENESENQKGKKANGKGKKSSKSKSNSSDDESDEDNENVSSSSSSSSSPLSSSLHSFVSLRSFESHRHSTVRVGSKPLLLFVGGLWDSDGLFSAIRNMFLDIFNVSPLDFIDMKGIDRVICFTTLDDTKKILMRQFAINANGKPMEKHFNTSHSSSSPLPPSPFEEIGPRISLTVRRHHFSGVDLAKLSMRFALKKSDKDLSLQKNIEISSLGDTMGRIHMKSQNISNVAIAKLKGLKGAKRMRNEIESKNKNENHGETNGNGNDDGEGQGEGEGPSVSIDSLSSLPKRGKKSHQLPSASQFSSKKPNDVDEFQEGGKGKSKGKGAPMSDISHSNSKPKGKGNQRGDAMDI